MSYRSAVTCLSFLLCVGVVACGSDDGPAATGDVSDSSGGADVSDDAVSLVSDSTAGDGTGDDGTTTADAGATADTSDEPGCGYEGAYLIPGPCEDGHDAELAAKARRVERTWQTFNAAHHGANTDLGVGSEDDRALIDTWVNEHDDWDFEAFAGKSPLDVIGAPGTVPGLYAGVGVAADAYRYGVLRDQGYPAAEVENARAQLLRGLAAFDKAATLPGVPGVIARSWALKAGGAETTPQFDEDGSPLPEKKTNGTWRDDGSGLYPDHIWVDSCSRDYMLGWVKAAGAAWEVIAEDDTIGADVKAMLQGHALDLGRALREVRTDPAFCVGLDNCDKGLGYDLQIPDADGRRTLHGCLHEHDLDCTGVVGFIDNGFNAVMALGFVATWAFVSEDPELTAYLNDELIDERGLHIITRDSLFLVALGQGSNWSGWNMAFGGMWLAQRYVFHEEAREALRVAVKDSLYDIDGGVFLPVDIGQSYFDFTYAAGEADLGAGLAPGHALDEAAMGRGIETLHGFRGPPYWATGVQNCPLSVCECSSESCPASEKTVEVHECVAPDGTEFNVLGCYGWKGTLITDTPVPMAIRPASNYHWRSNPYKPNGGGDHGVNGGGLLPMVDFRIAYWMARWAKVSD